jgi:HEAT repeat protein
VIAIRLFSPMSSATQFEEPLRRRRWQFSLLWLFGAVAVVGAGLSAFNLFVMRPWRDSAVRELVEATRQCDQTRIEAAVAKVHRLRAGEQAAAQVAPLLKGTDWTVKSHAAHALAMLGAVAVPELIRQVERQVAVEDALFHDLAAYGRCLQAPDAIRQVCDAAQNHPDGAVRATLIDALAMRYFRNPADSPVPHMEAEALGSLDSAAASRAESAFEAAARILRQTFLASLTDVDPRVRESAAGALGSFRAGDPTDAEVWSELAHALEDDDFSVRFAAASALAAIDRGRAGFALPTVLATLESPDPNRCIAAAYAVRALDPTKFADVWPALRTAMRGDDGNIRVNAILAVQSFGAAAAPAIPDLIGIVSHPKADPDAFSFALRALTAIGVAAHDARVEEFYLSKVGDADWKSRPLWELVGFARQGSPRSLAALAAALDHKDDEFRLAAAACLGLVGPPAQSAIPNLQRALQDDSDAVRRNAADALQKISPPSGAGQGGERN